MAGDKVFPWQPADIRKGYQLGPCLGKGHLGHVRLVEQLDSGKLHVCKTILKERLQKESNMAELMSEINGIRLVGGHPNIVELLGQYEDDDAVHLVMDLCPGGDLFDFIADRRRLTEEESAFIVRQLSSALRHCHSRGLVHRDIKPENILLCGRRVGHSGSWLPVVKLGDFGMSIKLGSGEKTSGVAGSLTYMAPEMVKQEEYSKEIDIWSLGVVLYIALSGYVPFPGSTREDVFESTCDKEPNYSMDPWSSVSEQSKELVQWMLRKDPAERPTASEVLKHPWVLAHTHDLKVVAPSGSQGVPKASKGAEKAVSGELGTAAGVPGPGFVCDKCGDAQSYDTVSTASAPAVAVSKKLPPLHPPQSRRKGSQDMSPRDSSNGFSGKVARILPFSPRFGSLGSPRDPGGSPRAFGGEKSSSTGIPLLSCTQPTVDEGSESGTSVGTGGTKERKWGIGRHRSDTMSPVLLSCVMPAPYGEEWGGRGEEPGEGEGKERRGFYFRNSNSRSELRPQRRSAQRSPMLACARPFADEGVAPGDQEESGEESGDAGDVVPKYRVVQSSGGHSAGARVSCIPRRDTSRQAEEEFVHFRR